MRASKKSGPRNMTILESNVINAAKALVRAQRRSKLPVRAKDPSVLGRFGMLILSVEALENNERLSRKAKAK